MLNCYYCSHLGPIALACETLDGLIVTRVSIVNERFQVLYDTPVIPYFNGLIGTTPRYGGEPFYAVRNIVRWYFDRACKIIGYNLFRIFEALKIDIHEYSHKKEEIQECRLFVEAGLYLRGENIPHFRDLTRHFLLYDFPRDSTSLMASNACMQLFKKYM